MNYLTDEEANTYLTQAKTNVEEKNKELEQLWRNKAREYVEKICNYCISVMFETLEKAVNDEELFLVENIKIERCELLETKIYITKEIADDIQELLSKVGIDVEVEMDFADELRCLIIDLEKYRDLGIIKS